MTTRDELPTPANRELLHSYLTDATAQHLATLTGFAENASEMTSLIADAAARRLVEVEEELAHADIDLA